MQENNEQPEDGSRLERMLVRLNTDILPSIKVQTRQDFFEAYRKQKAALQKRSSRSSPTSVKNLAPTDCDGFDSDGEDDVPPWLNVRMLDAYERMARSPGTSGAVKYMNEIRRLHGCTVRQSDEDLSNYVMLNEFMLCTVPDLFRPDDAQVANASEEQNHGESPPSTADISASCGFTRDTYPDVCDRNRNMFISYMNKFVYYNYFEGQGTCLETRNYREFHDEDHIFYALTSALFGPQRDFLCARMSDNKEITDVEISAVEEKVHQVLQALLPEVPDGTDIFASHPHRKLHPCDKLFFKDQETHLEYDARRQGDPPCRDKALEEKAEGDEPAEADTGDDGETTDESEEGETTEESYATEETTEDIDESEGGTEEEDPKTREDYTRDQLWDHILELNTTIQEKDDQKKKTAELVMLLKSENGLLKSHTDKMTRLTERLTGDKEKLNTLCNRLRDRVHRYREKDARMRAAVQELRQIESAVHQYDELVIINEGQAAKIEELQGQSQGQVAKIEELQDQNQEQAAKIEELQNRNQGLQSTVESVEQNGNHEFQDIIESQALSMKEKEDLNRKLGRDLEDTQDRVRSLQEKVLRAEAKEQEDMEHIAHLKRLGNASATEKDRYLSDLLTEKESKLDKLTQKIKEKDEELVKLRQVAKRFELRSEKLGKVKSIEDELNRQMDLKETAQHEVKVALDQLSEQRAAVEKLLFEKHKKEQVTKEQLKEAGALTKHAEKKFGELEAKYKKIQAEMAKKESQLVLLTAFKAQAEAGASAELQAARKLADDCKGNADSLRKELKSLQNQRLKNEKKITELEAQKTMDGARVEVKAAKKLAEKEAEIMRLTLEVKQKEKKAREVAGALEEKKEDLKNLQRKFKEADKELMEKEKAVLKLQAAADSNKIIFPAAEVIKKDAKKKEEELKEKLSKKANEIAQLRSKFIAELRAKQDQVDKSMSKCQELEDKQSEIQRSLYHAEEQLLIREEELQEYREQERGTPSGDTPAAGGSQDELDGILTPLHTNMTARRHSGHTLVENTKLQRTLRENVTLKKLICDAQSNSHL